MELPPPQQPYVIAHELRHHVQTLLRITHQKAARWLKAGFEQGTPDACDTFNR